jgi:8-oxo-dGTP pyrophosphatase MutT (NUDIX family)
LEPAETFEEAALRETEEELGLKGFSVKLLWERWIDFVYIDTPLHQHECFFLLKAEMQSLSPEVKKTDAKEGIIEMRWWTMSAILSTSESVFPEGLSPNSRKCQTDPPAFAGRR